MLAASAALAFSGDDWIVLVGLPVVAIAGGALAGSWWALALAVIPALLAWASDDPWAWLWGTAAVAIGFAFLAVGVALSRYARIPPRGLTVGSITALALVISVVAVSAGIGELRERDVTPDRPMLVEAAGGRLGPIRMRDSEAEVVRRLGEPARRGQDQSLEPTEGGDWYEIGGPTNFRGPRGSSEQGLRYPEHVVLLVDGRVYLWGTTDEAATTPEGVGVGDDLDLVRERFPQAHCFVQNEGTEYVTFPACEIEVCSGRNLHFGADPIRSVWVVATRTSGWEDC